MAASLKPDARSAAAVLLELYECRLALEDRRPNEVEVLDVVAASESDSELFVDVEESFLDEKKPRNPFLVLTEAIDGVDEKLKSSSRLTMVPIFLLLLLLEPTPLVGIGGELILVA